MEATGLKIVDTTNKKAEEIIKLHLEVGLALKTSLQKAILIGEKLREVKEELDHGEFLPWIEQNMPFSQRTAQNYIKLFDNKDKLLEANVEDLSSAYLIVAPKKIEPEHFENDGDVEIPEAPELTTDPKERKRSQYAYWDHLGPLVEKMNQVHKRLASMRDQTTPIALGHMIGNIKDMANVLETWEPGMMDDCPVCEGKGCDLCVNGQAGRFQESDN